MRKSPFFIILVSLLIFIFVYVSIFIMYHIYLPQLSPLNIEVTQSTENPEIKYIVMTPKNKLSKYYILVYEHTTEDNWIYFSTSHTSKDAQSILNELLPSYKDKYYLVEGSTDKNTHTFSIKSKYPITHTSHKEHVFDAYLVVPYKFFPFPTFYYTQHQVFFVDVGI